MSDSETELAALVPSAVSGDRRALQEVIRLIHPQVVRYCRARIGGHRHPTADDVAQEVCLAVATSLPKYEDKGRPFMAYVYGIAFNKVADAHRTLGRDHSVPTEDLPEQTVSVQSPEEYALVADGSNRVRELLDTLSEKARNIVILRVFVGLSAEETAAAVGSTPGAVRVAQHRALGQLRKRLGESQ